MYLGLEGVVFARHSSIRRSHAEQYFETLPLLHALARIASKQTDFAIVLNSWLVVDFGYRSILNQLPEELARRTIGATMQGNRTHRRDITLPRVEILRGDILRRRLIRFAIVESVLSAIPYEHLEQSIVVDGTSDDEQAEVAEKISQLLSANMDVRYSDGDGT